MASLDIGIDLGTCNMIAGNRQTNVIVREPTILAIDPRTDKVTGIGDEVKNMLGREHPNIKIYHPVEHGVISEYSMTQILTKYLFEKVGKSSMFKPRVVACIPCTLTDLEAQSMVDTMKDAGARYVRLIQEPVAAALGLEISTKEPVGNLIVDIGAGTTDVAVISMGGMVASLSTRYAGNSIDEAIERFIRSNYNVLIGAKTAEQIKIQILSMWQGSENISMEVKGRGIVTGLPTKVVVERNDLYPVVEEITAEIVKAVQQVLEITPPELAGDIISKGLYLTGGGAMITDIDKMLEERLRVSVNIPDNPVELPLIGALRSFDYWSEEYDGFYNPDPVSF